MSEDRARNKELNYYGEGEHNLGYATPKSAGMDLPYYDPDKESIFINPGERVALPSGVYCEFPFSHFGLLDTRSSTSKKKLMLACRTIDEDYRGNIHVILINCGLHPVEVERGEFLAHMIILPYVQPVLTRLDSKEELSDSVRGTGHSGSTGVGVNKEVKDGSFN